MNNEMILYCILAVVFLIAIGIYFFNLDKKHQLETVKEWLLLAVVQAEKELGGGTGQIKLRFVYDLFLQKFKWLSKFISFNQFSIMVDEALDIMRNLLNSNQNLEEYINK